MGKNYPDYCWSFCYVRSYESRQERLQLQLLVPVVLIYLQRFAIRCMRELKLNRGLSQRNSSVACKICSKEFTAAATLMYHYRSHASMYHTSISQSYIISFISSFLGLDYRKVHASL